MTEQQWNFAGIEAAASAIQGNVTSIHSLLDEGKQSLTKLAAAWGGSGSEDVPGCPAKMGRHGYRAEQRAAEPGADDQRSRSGNGFDRRQRHWDVRIGQRRVRVE